MSAIKRYVEEQAQRAADRVSDDPAVQSVVFDALIRNVGPGSGTWIPDLRAGVVTEWRHYAENIAEDLTEDELVARFQQAIANGWGEGVLV